MAQERPKIKFRPKGEPARSHRSKDPERKNPGSSKWLKELWADPERRAALLAKRAAVLATAPPEKRPGRRVGAVNGMRKWTREKMWAEAKASAEKTMAKLEKAGLFDDAVDDKVIAREALQRAIEVMRSPQNQQIRLAAAKLVLEFTKSKPVSKSELTVNKAEEWLKQVAQDHERDSRDAETPVH